MTFSRSRIILATMAVFLTFPAQARNLPGTQIPDIAARAPYPIEHATAYRQPRQTARHRVERQRVVTRGQERELARPERSYGAGIIRSGKTGEIAHVSPQYAARFQSFLDDLESHGATVYYMGGIRPGHCSLGSQHPCGWAVDFCQDYYGHVSGLKDCNLPRPAEFHELVRAHGLYDGSIWCHSDYGHVQAKDSGGCSVAAHGSWGHGHVRLASMTGSIQFVARHHLRHHHRLRYARR